MTTTLTERHNQILQLLRQKGYISVSELSLKLEVSEMTIRRDFDTLEELGLITRHHGGASLTTDSRATETNFRTNGKENREANIKIGVAALDYIKDGEVVIFDSGPTTLQIALNLFQQRATIVTNSLPIIYELSRLQNIYLISIGGQLLVYNQSFVGPQALQIINSINANVAFITVAGFSLSRGLTVPDLLEAEVKRAMMHVAEKVILVMESSKVNTVSLATISQVDEVDILITDDCLQTKDKELIEKKGIEVVIAKD